LRHCVFCIAATLNNTNYVMRILYCFKI
jgi:hypothetical protein